jgi:hypothetical protein
MSLHERMLRRFQKFLSAGLAPPQALPWDWGPNREANDPDSGEDIWVFTFRDPTFRLSSDQQRTSAEDGKEQLCPSWPEEILWIWVWRSASGPREVHWKVYSDRSEVKKRIASPLPANPNFSRLTEVCSERKLKQKVLSDSGNFDHGLSSGTLIGMLIRDVDRGNTNLDSSDFDHGFEFPEFH